jgi:hypothetical protein
MRPVAPPAIPRISATIFLKTVEVGVNTPRGNIKYVDAIINATGIKKNGVLLHYF